MTASLLMINNKIVVEREERIVVLPEKSRHIIGTCGRTQRRTSPAEGNHMGMDVWEKDMLLILYIISVAQVTRGVGIVSSGSMWARKKKRK